MTDYARLERQYDAPGLTRTLVTCPLSDVPPEAVSWLWPGRIPFGKLTMLDGDPGLGKSLVTLDLAARVSTGRPMPEEATGSEPASVVILTAEDGLGDTVRPRLDALGADTTKIHAVTGVLTDADAESGVTFPMDLEGLRLEATKIGAKLIIIDPFVAFIGEGVNTRIDHDVRRLLAPLARLAAATGAAVVVVRHLNKSGMGSALYRGGGSIAFIGAARAGLLIARDPDDEHRRVLAITKMNLAPEPPSLAFTIENGAGGLGVPPRIAWLGETVHRANDLVRIEDDHQEAGDLKSFLRDLLADGPRLFIDVRKSARAAGFEVSDRSLRRARQALGIQPVRQGFGTAVTWTLPSIPAHSGHSGHVSEDVQNGRYVSGMDPDAAARDALQAGA